MKRLIRKENNVSGVRSVETVKEDRSSAEGNPAQTTKNEFATRMTSGISLWPLSGSGAPAAGHRGSMTRGEGPPPQTLPAQNNLDLYLHSLLIQLKQLL